MKLESLLARARYCALALPLFALFSTAHAGCSSGPSGYGYGYGQGRPGSSGSSGGPENCTAYSGYDGRGGSYSYSNCDDDGYVGR